MLGLKNSQGKGPATSGAADGGWGWCRRASAEEAQGKGQDGRGRVLHTAEDSERQDSERSST